MQLFARSGGEFLVNTATVGDQQLPTITALLGGGFVVAWTDFSGQGGDASNAGIKAQLFDASGTKVGGEFLVNTATLNNQSSPAITALSGGGFVVVWNDSSGQGGDSSFNSTKAQVFNASGARVGAEFLVNTTTAGAQFTATITALPGAGFVVAWADGSGQGADASGFGIKAQLFDANGAKIGTEFPVNTATLNNQISPEITALSGGRFVVVWMDESGQGGDASSNGIKAQIFDANGAKVGTEFLVNTATLGDQFEPTITALPEGGFVVAWRDTSGQGGDVSSSSIKAQQFDANGAKVGVEFLVNTTTLNSQEQPTIIALADGSYVVAWTDSSGQGGDGSSRGVKAQLFDATGAKVGAEFLVNTATLNNQITPDITALPGGGFVVAWTDSSGQGGDTSSTSIKAQIFAPTAAAPSDISLSNDIVAETAIEGRAIAELASDGGVNSAYTYTILSDSSGGAFAIDGNRLIVTDNALLDHETAPSVTLRVRTTDDNGASYEEDLVVTVADSPMPELRLADGGELLVNATTPSDQQQPTITTLVGGGFVVAWRDFSGQGDDASSSGIRAQLFDGAGAKVGGEFLVNTTTLNEQGEPTIAALSGGGFVVAWTDQSGEGGDASSHGVKAQLFDATGAKVGGEFLVNTATFNPQLQPTIAALPGGGFVVAWIDFSGQGGDASQYGIKAQFFDAAGAKVGGEFLVNTTTVANQAQPTITTLPGGGFVVAWMDNSGQGGDASNYGIKAQLFDATGGKVGGEFLVNTETLNAQQQPTIAALSGGGFVVAWSDFSGQGGDASSSGIKAQLFDAGGEKVGGELPVNTATLNAQQEPTITALPGGGFVVAWQDQSGQDDTSNNGIKAQLFDAAGAKVGGEFLVNTATLNAQLAPTVTALPDGRIVIVWADGSGQVGDVSGFGIKATIFSPANSAIAFDDLSTTAGDQPLAGDVFADNGAGADRDQSGATLAVTAVNGQPASVGQQVMLASGALLTLNATGSYSYDPNGAFDYLVSAATAAATGVSNSQATDSFIYTLAGGDTATVTVTINGVDGAGDQLRGSAGNDTITGTAATDLIDLRSGGDDVATSGDGDDGFYFGSAYTSADSVDGGAGVRDQIGLQGDYSGGVTLGSLLNTELVVLLSGTDARFGDTAGNLYDYVITSDGGTMASNNRLTIQANTLQVGEDLTFNGSASAIDFLIYAGLGTDTLTGGSGNDGFFFGDGRFGAGDAVNGGAGAMDQLGLQGNFTITFGATQLSGLEFIVLLSAGDNRFGADGGTVYYDLTTDDGNVAAGQRMIVSGTTLTASETLVFRGFFENDGNFSIFSGAGDDYLTGGQLSGDIIFGGAGDDLIEGHDGADQLTGGAGDDLFHYLQASHSTNAARDQIMDFATGDTIDLRGLSSNTGGDFTFIGSDTQSGERQLQVIQNGNAATVNVFIDGDNIADLVIDVTVVDGHTLTLADFAGAIAPAPAGMSPLKQAAAPDFWAVDAASPSWEKLYDSGFTNDFAL